MQYYHSSPLPLLANRSFQDNNSPLQNEINDASDNNLRGVVKINRYHSIFSCRKYRTPIFESKSIFGIRPYKYHNRANRMV